jgi:putative spermidine/putrescine transport system ATP-binding protein
MSASIDIDRVSKSYDGATQAVDGVEMTIAQGEFFSLLGPSGCGKTTTLRMIAGFETPSQGMIRVGGADITHVPAHKRDMGMVFQNYALFPHRTVAENVAFGLRMRGMDKATIAGKVEHALEMVSLQGYGERLPRQLSGGQQQRVALARAIVIEPRVLLCDEPLGALDKKLRQQMQFELKQLQKSLGVTLVFVTHDQEEALAMSDRIAVMNGGRIEQIGTPSDIYNRPSTRFVADFIGDSNLMRGERMAGGDGKTLLRVAEGLAFPLPGMPADFALRSVALRPEKIRITAARADLVHGEIESANFQGGSILYRVAVAGRHLLVEAANSGGPPARQGERVGLSWNPEDLVLLAD